MAFETSTCRTCHAIVPAGLEVAHNQYHTTVDGQGARGWRKNAPLLTEGDMRMFGQLIEEAVDAEPLRTRPATRRHADAMEDVGAHRENQAS